MASKSSQKQLENIIQKEQQYDKRKRRRELNKRARKTDILGGKSAYKRVSTQFDSVT